jgi:uncharacterized protein YeaC (DUF1315 family)
MTQEDKDKLLKKLNQMVEHSNKAITIWTRLMEQGKYPPEDCLVHINLSNQQKEACLKMIRKYDTRR